MFLIRTNMWLNQWLQPGRRLLLIFFVTTGALLIALGWMSFQLVRQDRALATQRAQESRDHAADLAVAALQKNVSQIEEQLAGLCAAPLASLSSNAERFARRLPRDSALLVFSRGQLQAYPAHRLLFYPEISPVKEPARAVFARAEELEFQLQDYTQASAVVSTLIHNADPAIRAEALLRLGRSRWKAGSVAEALAAYSELARSDSTARIAGLPATLAAREARLLILEKQKASGDLRGEASELCSALRAGVWTIQRGTYEFYRNEACSRAGAVTPDSGEAVALSSAAVYMGEQWASTLDEAAGGRRIFWEDDQPVLLVWKRSPERMAALAAGPSLLRSSWLAPIQPLLEKEGIRIAITDPDGRSVLGPAPNGSAYESVRLASATQPPWMLHAISTQTGAAGDAAARRRLMLTALLTLFLLVLGGCYFIGRATLREIAVARVQSDFISAVSHEFRTPVTALRQLSELLAGGRVANDADRDEYYQALSRESKRLQRLIEGLLNFGRAEAAGMHYRMETLDAADFLHSVVAEFRRDSEPKGYRIELTTHGAPMVRADRAALACVVRNLLDNAVNYSPECLTVWVELRTENRRVLVRVRDQGIGIPQSEQRQIFEKFVRGAEAKARSIRGVGVGLAMARQIVIHHGGEIEVESRPGEGSAFTVRLPEANQ